MNPVVKFWTHCFHWTPAVIGLYTVVRIHISTGLPDSTANAGESTPAFVHTMEVFAVC